MPPLSDHQDSESFTTKIKTVDFSKAIKDLDHNPVVEPEDGIRRYATKWTAVDQAIGSGDINFLYAHYCEKLMNLQLLKYWMLIDSSLQV